MMCDLEDWPHHLVLLLALMRSIFRVLEFVGEFEESVFDVLEAVRRRFAVFGATNRWHRDVSD